MLNGIGGKTVAEAKANISFPEYLDWLAYLRKHGSLNPGYRIDLAVARLCSVMAHGKIPPSDFMPEYEAEEVGIDDIAKLMGVKQVKNNG